MAHKMVGQFDKTFRKRQKKNHDELIVIRLASSPPLTATAPEVGVFSNVFDKKPVIISQGHLTPLSFVFLPLSIN